MLAITHVVALPLQPAMVAVTTRSVAGSTSSVAGALTLKQVDVRATGVTRTVDVQRSRKVCNWNPLMIVMPLLNAQTIHSNRAWRSIQLVLISASRFAQTGAVAVHVGKPAVLFGYVMHV